MGAPGELLWRLEPHELVDHSPYAWGALGQRAQRLALTFFEDESANFRAPRVDPDIEHPRSISRAPSATVTAGPSVMSLRVNEVLNVHEPILMRSRGALNTRFTPDIGSFAHGPER
jgi:hypothetical protein